MNVYKYPLFASDAAVPRRKTGRRIPSPLTPGSMDLEKLPGRKTGKTNCHGNYEWTTGAQCPARARPVEHDGVRESGEKCCPEGVRGACPA